MLHSHCLRKSDIYLFSLTDEIGVISTVCPHHCNPNDYKTEFKSGAYDMAYNVMVWAFICE